MKNLLLVAFLTLLFAPSCTRGAFMENPPLEPPITPPLKIDVDPSRPYFDTPPTQGEYELKSTAEGRAASHLYLIRELEKRNFDLELRIMILERRLQDMRDGSNIPSSEKNTGDI